MICYICSKHVLKSLKVDGVSFGYCDDHQADVQIGVIKLALTGSVSTLVGSKSKYKEGKISATQLEFDKQYLPEDLNELDD